MVIFVIVKEEQCGRQDAVQVGGEMRVFQVADTPHHGLLVGRIILPSLTREARF